MSRNFQYKDCQLRHIRTYHYAGRYTENLIKRMESRLQKEQDEETKKFLKEKIEKAKISKSIQSEFLAIAKNYYFFEIRDKPLQFSPATLKLFQKGVDVQLAVDLVEFAYKNVFDVAVVLSGDIDLIESVRTVKNLGKHVIIMGDESVTSAEMRRSADLFIDMGRMDEKQLDMISHKKKAPQEKSSSIRASKDALNP